MRSDIRPIHFYDHRGEWVNIAHASQGIVDLANDSSASPELTLSQIDGELPKNISDYYNHLIRIDPKKKSRYEWDTPHDYENLADKAIELIIHSSGNACDLPQIDEFNRYRRGDDQACQSELMKLTRDKANGMLGLAFKDLTENSIRKPLIAITSLLERITLADNRSFHKIRKISKSLDNPALRVIALSPHLDYDVIGEKDRYFQNVVDLIVQDRYHFLKYTGPAMQYAEEKQIQHVVDAINFLENPSRQKARLTFLNVLSQRHKSYFDGLIDSIKNDGYNLEDYEHNGKYLDTLDLGEKKSVVKRAASAAQIRTGSLEKGSLDCLSRPSGIRLSTKSNFGIHYRANPNGYPSDLRSVFRVPDSHDGVTVKQHIAESVVNVATNLVKENVLLALPHLCEAEKGKVINDFVHEVDSNSTRKYNFIMDKFRLVFSNAYCLGDIQKNLLAQSFVRFFSNESQFDSERACIDIIRIPSEGLEHFTDAQRNEMINTALRRSQKMNNSETEFEFDDGIILLMNDVQKNIHIGILKESLKASSVYPVRAPKQLMAVFRTLNRLQKFKYFDTDNESKILESLFRKNSIDSDASWLAMAPNSGIFSRPIKQKILEVLEKINSNTYLNKILLHIIDGDKDALRTLCKSLPFQDEKNFFLLGGKISSNLTHGKDLTSQQKSNLKAEVKHSIEVLSAILLYRISPRMKKNPQIDFTDVALSEEIHSVIPGEGLEDNPNARTVGFDLESIRSVLGSLSSRYLTPNLYSERIRTNVENSLLQTLVQLSAVAIMRKNVLEKSALPAFYAKVDSKLRMDRFSNRMLADARHAANMDNQTLESMKLKSIVRAEIRASTCSILNAIETGNNRLRAETINEIKRTSTAISKKMDVVAYGIVREIARLTSSLPQEIRYQSAITIEEVAKRSREILVANSLEAHEIREICKDYSKLQMNYSRGLAQAVVDANGEQLQNFYEDVRKLHITRGMVSVLFGALRVAFGAGFF